MPDPLRPRSLDEFVCSPGSPNAAVVEDLRVALLAAKIRRDEGLPWAAELSTLCTGEPGLGKSSLAYVMAHELDIHLFAVSGSSLANAAQVRAWLYRLAFDPDGPYLMVVEEAEGMAASAFQEFLLPVAENRYIGDDGQSTDLQDTVFVFTANRLSAISPALFSRCTLRFQLLPYAEADLARIAMQSAGRLGYCLDEEAANLLASYSQNEARAVNSLLKTVVTHLVANDTDTRISRKVVEPILSLRLYPSGLTRVQHQILEFLARRPKGRAGLRTLSHGIGQDPRDVEGHHEKFLLREGFVSVETGAGRLITGRGLAYLSSLKGYPGTQSSQKPYATWLRGTRA